MVQTLYNYKRVAGLHDYKRVRVKGKGLGFRVRV